MILREGEGILIQDRMPWDEYGFDYGFFGGKIEEGETPEQALKREIKEELNIEIKDYKFIKHSIKEVPELDLEIEYYLYIAPIPDLSKIKCKEGKPFLTDMEEAFTLKIDSAGIEMLNEIKDLKCKAV